MHAGRRENEEGGQEDLLVAGRDRPGPIQRLPRRCRLGLAIGTAFLLGLVAGGYGGYAWLGSVLGGNRDAVDLSARIRGPQALDLPYPPYRLPVDVHNAGQQAVTVRQADLSVPGFLLDRGLSEPVLIRGGTTETIIFGVRPDCARDRTGGPATLRLRLREHSGDVRPVTLRPAVTESRIRAGRSILCGQPVSSPVIVAETRQARQGGGELRTTMRLELEHGPSGRDDPRLLGVDLEAAGVTLDRPTPEGAPTFPATVTLRVRARDCARATESADDPAMLRVTVISTGGPHLVYAHADTEFGLALRRYVDSHCSG